MLKPLQVDNQHQGSLVNLESLGGLHMIFAIRAIPLVVLIKHFWLFKLLQTVSKCYGSVFLLFWCCLCSSIFFNIECFCALVLIKEYLINFDVPHYFYDNIFLSSVISVLIETHIRGDTNLFEEIIVGHLVVEGDWAAFTSSVAAEEA